MQSAVSGCMDNTVKFRQHMITGVQKTQLHQTWGYCQEREWGWGGRRMGGKSQLGVRSSVQTFSGSAAVWRHLVVVVPYLPNYQCSRVCETRLGCLLIRRHLFKQPVLGRVAQQDTGWGHSSSIGWFDVEVACHFSSCPCPTFQELFRPLSDNEKSPDDFHHIYSLISEIKPSSPL